MLQLESPEKLAAIRSKALETRAQIKNNGFEIQDLRRVRAEIEREARLLRKLTDPGQIFKLSASLDRLRAQERKLAGRPDPGSYRPTAPKHPKAGGDIKPQDL